MSRDRRIPQTNSALQYTDFQCATRMRLSRFCICLHIIKLLIVSLARSLTLCLKVPYTYEMFENLVDNFKTKFNFNSYDDDEESNNNNSLSVALNFLQRIARKSYTALAQHKDNEAEHDCFGSRRMFPRVYGSAGNACWGPIDLAPREKDAEYLDNVLDKFCRAIRPAAAEGRRCQQQLHSSMDRIIKVNRQINADAVKRLFDCKECRKTTFVLVELISSQT